MATPTLQHCPQESEEEELGDSCGNSLRRPVAPKRPCSDVENELMTSVRTKEGTLKDTGKPTQIFS